MLFRKTFIRCLAAVFLVASAAAQAQSPESAMARVQRTKILRVGVINGAVPYFNKDLASGKWQGFGPDFGDSLAKKFGVKVDYVETTWGNSVLDLEANKIDIMFGLAPTPARKEMVGFTETLFENTYTAVCKKGYPTKTWEQMNNPDTHIALDIGSSHDLLATKILPKADVTRLESSGAATLALQSGRADCQLLVILLAKPLLVKRPDIGVMQIPTPVYSAPTSIGIRKESDPAFLAAVNSWLADARAKGEIKGVILKNMETLAGVPASSFPAEVKF